MKLGIRLRTAFQLEGRSAAWLAAATVIVALHLLLLQALLYAPDGSGIESFLGELGTKAAQQLASWQGSQRLPFARLYLAADTLFFVPVYAAFGLALARAVRAHSEVPQPHSLWWRVLEAPLLVLVLVDLAENALGLARMGTQGVATALGVSALSVQALARLPALRASVRAMPRMRYVLLGVAALALFVALPRNLTSPAPGALTLIAVGAHRAKLVFAPLAFGGLALAGLAWLFGVDRLLARAFGAVDSSRAQEAARERANLRGVIWDLLGRSRYVMLTLLVIGVLVAGMDQGRDVLYAMAASTFREGPEGWKAALGSLAALFALACSTGGLEYSCWLWTRSVGQIQPARLDPAVSASAAGLAVKNAPPLVSGPLHALADGFAKYWARALAFVPIVLFVGLHARVVRDGVMSGLDGQPPRMAPVFVVLAAGVLLIVFGVWLLMRHADPDYNQAGYYYSALSWQQWAESIGLFPEQQKQELNLKYRMLCGKIRVYWLPLLLGAGLLLCRLADVFPPHWWLWQTDYVPSC